MNKIVIRNQRRRGSLPISINPPLHPYYLITQEFNLNKIYLTYNNKQIYSQIAAYLIIQILVYLIIAISINPRYLVIITIQISLDNKHKHPYLVEYNKPHRNKNKPEVYLA
jgi:hypothetical protein